MAPVEAENELWYKAGVFTLKSGIVYLLLMLIIGAIFFRTLYIRLPMLMKQEYISSAWDFMFLVPMSLAVLILWLDAYRGTMNITEENKIFSVNIILQS